VYNKPIVPKDFDVPLGKNTSRCLIRPLSIRDVTRDFEAVMSSCQYLKKHFNPASDWPENLSLEQNMIDLGWHEYEFQNRTSFTYTITDLENQRTLGCCYFYPSLEKDYEIRVSYWVRESERNSGLDEHVGNTLRAWIESDWPFKNAFFVPSV
jgi:hypothetical protein